MTATKKALKRDRLKGFIKRVSSKSKKNPSAFFGMIKDGVDGLAYQKKLRNEWK